MYSDEEEFTMGLLGTPPTSGLSDQLYKATDPRDTKVPERELDEVK
jgi:hypothetical protein